MDFDASVSIEALLSFRVGSRVTVGGVAVPHRDDAVMGETFFCEKVFH